MIKLDKINLQRGSKLLLEHASAVLFSSQKIALIGANGTGKSSLFQLLLGQLSADDGNINIPSQWHIAHMAQEAATSNRSALDYIIDGDQQLRAIEAAIADAESQGNHHQLGELHQQLDAIDGYNVRVYAERLMLGLGFQLTDISRPTNHFSGGWRIRLNLAQALISRADLL